MRKGAALNEQRIRDSAILEETRFKIDSLNNRINVLQSIVDEYQGIDTAYQAVILKYKDEIEKTKQQRDNAVATAKILDRLLRRQKRKTIIAIGATAAVAIGIAILVK